MNPKSSNAKSVSALISIKSEKANDSYLDKKALEIQRKIEKIEKLKQKRLKVDEKLNELKKLYALYAKKTDIKVLENREVYIVKLYEKFNQKSFSAFHKELMFGIILNEINVLMERGYSSEVLQNIQKEFQKISTAEMDDDERAFQSEMAKEFMKAMGFDVAEDFDINQITDEDFIEKQFKNFQENNFKEEATDKEFAKRELIETTNKDFAKLYKRLAKKCHPDLTLDPYEKEKRTQLMKQLSQAWEDRNYLQLMLLKNEIDSNDEFQINEEQAKSLITSLNKEIKNIEAEIYVIKNMEPKSSFYFKNFGMGSRMTMTKKIKEYNDFLILELNDIQHSTGKLKTQKSTKKYLDDIDSFEDDFDPFNDFFFED